MTLVWPTIERFLAEHGAAVLVTLSEVQGSSPREVGTRMVVRPDGRFSGTIGGGALEWLALAEAQTMMAGPGAKAGPALRRLSKALGPELGQCCGGRVAVTLERFERADLEHVAPLADAERAGGFVTVAETGKPSSRTIAPSETAPAGIAYARLADGRIAERFGADATPFYLFGAGHVGHNLVLALAPLPFAVTWIDPRPSAFPSHVPGTVTCRTSSEPVRLLDGAPDGAFVAIMTHSHALDLDIVAAALLARRFPYVGVIGSATKRARFVNALRQLGIGADDVGRLICPIGLPEITDKAPAAIAAGMAAQLLIRRDSAAASKRHSETAPGQSAAGRLDLASGGISHA